MNVHRRYQRRKSSTHRQSTGGSISQVALNQDLHTIDVMPSDTGVTTQQFATRIENAVYSLQGQEDSEPTQMSAIAIKRNIP